MPLASFVIEFLSSKLIGSGLCGRPCSLLPLLGGASTSLAATRVVVVVIVVVGLQNFASQLLLPPVDICVKLVAVLSDRELLVVVDRDIDAPSAHWLVVWVVELGHVGVPQSLVCRQTPSWVELQQIAKQVESVVTRCWEQIPKAARL